MRQLAYSRIQDLSTDYIDIHFNNLTGQLMQFVYKYFLHFTITPVAFIMVLLCLFTVFLPPPVLTALSVDNGYSSVTGPGQN